ncbi:MAG TPA: sigma 54-interacting transcriptional regulator [Firmicutes bacterium]|nr:sigma 54-interacting transcriptional regulator [Candidatus Fermentithermobacillaceae bacterium]
MLVIQEHEVMRLGNDKVILVGVSVTAGSYKDLWELTKTRQFRSDLYLEVSGGMRG